MAETIKLKRNNLGYIRHTVFSVEEVMNLLSKYDKKSEDIQPLLIQEYTRKGVSRPLRRLKYKGYEFKLGGYRLLTFLHKGIKCKDCGVEGKFFSLDSAIEGEKPHINLIGVRSDSTEVLMTSDHIYPKSLGGSDDIENRQTMCVDCNVRKSNHV